MVLQYALATFCVIGMHSVFKQCVALIYCFDLAGFGVLISFYEATAVHDLHDLLVIQVKFLSYLVEKSPTTTCSDE